MAENRFFNGGRRDFFRLALGATAALGLGVSSQAVLGQTPAATPLKIATIGSGRIGSALGTLWVKAGHQVMFSSRHPEDLKSLVDSLGPLARAGTPAEAIAFADVVLLAVPFGAMPQIAKDYGRELATKRLVLDATNPIVPRDGEVAAQAREKGAGVAAAELLPGAHLVRAFNAIGFARLPEEGKRPESERIGMPMAGDDANAIALASILVREVGLEPVLIGSLTMGKYLIPGTPLAGEHTPQQIREILTTLK